MIQFENMRGNASPGQGTDAPAVIARRGQLSRNSIPLGAAPHGAPIGRGVPIQEKTPHYHTFASAALDPHPATHNPLLPFGKFTQTVIDVTSLIVALLFLIASGLGIVFALFILLFVRVG